MSKSDYKFIIRSFTNAINDDPESQIQLYELRPDQNGELFVPNRDKEVASTVKSMKETTHLFRIILPREHKYSPSIHFIYTNYS